MGNLVFNGEGPVMNGTWYNPETGDSFTVRDTYFQDNQLIVLTTDGRQLDYNFIQNYVKSDKPIPKKTTDPKPVVEEIPDEVKALIETPAETNDGLLPEDANLIRGLAPASPLGNLNTPTPSKPEPQNVNNVIIERALKGKPIPSIAAAVNWPNIPTTEIKLLTDVMGVSKDELIEWYMSQVDIANLKKIVADGMVNYINNFFPVEDKVSDKILPADPFIKPLVKNLNENIIATSESGPTMILADQPQCDMPVKKKTRTKKAKE